MVDFLTKCFLTPSARVKSHENVKSPENIGGLFFPNTSSHDKHRYIIMIAMVTLLATSSILML